VRGDGREAKGELRQRLLSERARRTDTQREAAGEAIARHVVARWGEVATVAAYLSVGTEPPTGPLIERLVNAGTRILMPVICGAELDWAVYDPAAGLRAGPLGINEPVGDRLGPDSLAAVDLVVVPALAVDATGQRLGRGRGYYDRALVGVTAPVVAVVFDSEVVSRVPAEPHDRAVDAIVCPAGLRFRANQ
jgi:5-formyltetrahydrofolate cyclo-ligase